MEVEKNLRSTTAMKMLAATMPTKVAAHHSIASMKRSIGLRFVSVDGEAAAMGSNRGLLERRLVLGDVGLERLHHRLGVEADLARGGFPLRLHRGHRLVPRVAL